MEEWLELKDPHPGSLAYSEGNFSLMLAFYSYKINSTIKTMYKKLESVKIRTLEDQYQYQFKPCVLVEMDEKTTIEVQIIEVDKETGNFKVKSTQNPSQSFSLPADTDVQVDLAKWMGIRVDFLFKP